MLKIFQKNKALTLTELLISSALIAIIMIGVTSFAISVKGYHDTVNKTTNLSMRATATMAMLKKDAAQAVGDRDHPGVLFEKKGTTGAVLCFRHDADDDPSSYANDVWYCYTQGGSWDLHRCGPMTDAQNPMMNGLTWFGHMPDACLDKLNTLLPLTKAVAGVRDPCWAVIVKDEQQRLKYIDITLETRHDREQAANSLTNPQVELKAHVYPLGMSWQ